MGDRWFASITDGEPEPEEGSGNATPGWMRYLVPQKVDVNYLEELKKELEGQTINGWEVYKVDVRRSAKDGERVNILYTEVWNEKEKRKIEVTSIYRLNGELKEEEISYGDGLTRYSWRDGEVSNLQIDNLTNLLGAAGYRVRLKKGKGEEERAVIDPENFAREFLEDVQNQPLPPEDCER